MARRTCSECRMDLPSHVGGCPEVQGSWDGANVEREVIPAECHVGGRVICDHREHRVRA
jgi:hypothetical protein